MDYSWGRELVNLQVWTQWMGEGTRNETRRHRGEALKVGEDWVQVSERAAGKRRRYLVRKQV